MKVVGYVASVVGIVVMALGFGFFGEVNFYGIDSLYVSGAGVALVVVGVVMVLMSGKGHRAKHNSEEVPIYEGVGKKRRVVGYRRD